MQENLNKMIMFVLLVIRTIALEIDITGNGGYMLYGIKYNMDVDSVRTILSKSDIWTIQNDQTDTIFCKDKSNTYYFDIYLENGSVKSLSLHSADSYCGYNHAE